MSDEQATRVPRVRIEAGPGPYDFKLLLNGVEAPPCVEEASIHLAYDEEPTVWLKLTATELCVDGRLRLPLDQLRELAAEEGYELVRTAAGPCLPGPLVYGRVKNLSPVPIGDSVLLYRVHSGKLNSISRVCDDDSELEFFADRATMGALCTYEVPRGHYATCLAEGLIRLGSAPNGDITCDARNDNVPSLASGPFEADIIRHHREQLAELQKLRVVLERIERHVAWHGRVHG